MRSKQPESEPNFANDSFLDVVANMVGIMIMLIVVVGLRSADSARDEVVHEAQADAGELAVLEQQGKELEADVNRLAEAIREVTFTAAGQRKQRELLAFRVAAGKQALAQRRAKVSGSEQEDAKVRGQLQAAEHELQQLRADLEQLASVGPAPPIAIESYPTPISQTVYGEEVHFQLRGGRITFIPMDELVDELRSQARQKVEQLRHLPEYTDMVGPIGGFRMRYTMARVNVAADTSDPRVQQVSTYAQLSQFTLTPVSDGLGETLEEALEGRSQFRASLVDTSARQTTVTLWVYPECFNMYRRLKQELYQQGFAVAGRPLPSGQPIGGSPQGSKSAAQ